jgi:hypothetical protein
VTFLHSRCTHLHLVLVFYAIGVVHPTDAVVVKIKLAYVLFQYSGDLSEDGH